MAKKKQKLPVTAIVSGVALLVYIAALLALVWFDVLPREMAGLWQRLLGVVCAALAALTVFETTRERETAEELVRRLRTGQSTDFGRRVRRPRSKAGSIRLPLVGDVSKALLGSIGAVLVVGAWWLTPWAPVTVRVVKIGDLTVPLGEEIAAPLLVMPDGEMAVCQPPVPPFRAESIANLIDDDAEPFQLALKAIVEGKHNEASRLLTAAAKGDTEAGRIALARAQNAMYAGQFATAVQEYDNALASQPDDPPLLCQAAVANLQAGDGEKAQVLVDKATKICEEQEPRDQNALAFCLHLKAVLCVGRTNDFSKAEEFTNRAREMWNLSQNENRPLIAASLNNQAVVNVLLANYQGAEEIYRWAREMWQKASPASQHANLATTLINLATLECRMCQLDEAEKLLQQVQTVRGEEFPADDPRHAVDLCVAATLRLTRGQYQEASALAEEALAVLEESLGAEHALVAPVVSRLAESYSRQSLYAKAEPFGRRAETIVRQQWGDRHPFLAICLIHRADRYLAEDFGEKTGGLLPQVESLCGQAMEIAEQTLDENHPDVASILDAQGRLEIRRNELRSARRPLERAYEIRTEAFGEEHPAVAETLGNLAALNTSASMLDNGIRNYKQAIRTIERSLGTEHPDLVPLLYGQAKLHALARDFAAARPLLERALEIQRKTLPAFHPDLAVTLDACAVVLQNVNPPEPQLAEQKRAEAASIREKHAEIDHSE